MRFLFSRLLAGRFLPGDLRQKQRVPVLVGIFGLLAGKGEVARAAEKLPQSLPELHVALACDLLLLPYLGRAVAVVHAHRQGLLMLGLGPFAALLQSLGQ